MTDRRQFPGWAGSAAGLSFTSGLIGRAMAIPANHATGSLQDVEHIVIHMQDNRSFDQYFGAYNGVRGVTREHLEPPRPARAGISTWHEYGANQPGQGLETRRLSVPFNGGSKLHLPAFLS